MIIEALAVFAWLGVTPPTVQSPQDLADVAEADFAQGHLFHAAMPGSEVSRLIAEGAFGYSGISPGR